MKAVVLRGARSLALETVPDPVPGEQELVLRVTACGICGSDLHLHRLGMLPPGSVLGHEFSGEVVDSRLGFRAGERVCALPMLSCNRCARCRSGLGAYCEAQRTLGMGSAPGAFAEYVTVAAHETVRLPDALDAVRGALVEPLAVGLHAVRVARVRRGDGCLVLGGGPIGLACLLWARHFGGGPVLVCEKAPARRELALRLGASGAVPPEELDAELARTLPGGASVVLEAVGAPGMIQRGLDCVRFRGRLAVVGVCFGSDTIRPLPALTRETHVAFSMAYEKDDFQYAIDSLASGRIDPLPMLSARRSLEEIPAAFHALEAGGELCKVMFVA